MLEKKNMPHRSKAQKEVDDIIKEASMRKRMVVEDWRPHNTHFGDFKITSVQNSTLFKVPSFLRTAEILILIDGGWEVIVIERPREETEES